MAVTDYLRGTGTQADPYVVHTPAALKQMLTADAFSGKYFEVVADIDCGGETFVYSSAWNSNVRANFSANLNGYSCFNFKMQNAGDNSGYLYRDAAFTITNGVFDFYFLGSEGVATRYSLYSMTDVVFNAGKNIDVGAANTGNCIRCFSKFKINSQNQATGFYTVGISVGCIDVSSAPYDPNSYPDLVARRDRWIVDGVSYPKLIPQGRTDLTTAYAIKGVTKVGGYPKSRSVEAHIAAYFGNRKKLKSNFAGEYLINLGDVYDPHIVTHYDEYGNPFSANKPYALGDIIHPSSPNGYAYDCTTAGISAATAPLSWPITGTMISGSAIFTPRPIYKPESQLVQPAKINLLTGLPV